MKRLLLVLSLTTVFVFAALVSCTKEVKKIVEAPAAITVSKVVASDTTVTQGLPVTLNAEVETDASVDASTLTYTWYADKGTFHSNVGDTVVWTAPEEDGAVKVTVHVTDGTNIAIGTKNLGVNVYVATADTYYVGVETCKNCHDGGTGGAQYAGWSQTGHANAWADLQNSGHPMASCEPCHSVQQNNTPGNSGFDEVPTAKFEDVQCESCHGPGSAHADGAAASPPVDPLAALDVQTCAICHEGSHHPFYEDWQNSMHAKMNENHAFGLANCQPCHSGSGFVSEYDPNDADLFSNATTQVDLTCGACHDSHSADNPYQVRTMAAVTLVSGKTIAAGSGGAGQLCMQCHKARHSAEEQVPEGDAHFGPHHSDQADVLYGTSGDEDVNPGFTFASSGHGKIDGTCARCHVHASPYVSEDQPANTGHTFEPRVEACAECHGTITDFDQIMAKNDYDDNGTVEGLQVEVQGLMTKLAQTLVTYDNTNYGSQYFGNPDLNSTDLVTVVMDSIEATDGDTSAAAVKIRTGGFNLFYESNEGSEGVHNPAYVVQLLQQSILYYDPNALSPGVVLRDKQATTFVAMN
jgi:hypothetical protein